MTRKMFFGADHHLLRDRYWNLAEIAERIHRGEDELVKGLMPFFERKMHVNFGFKSRRRFCVGALKFTPEQSQRIVARVRRLQEIQVDETAVTGRGPVV